jgi:protein-disulfide isomerase
MLLTRRILLCTAAAGALAPHLALAAANPQQTDRTVGQHDAKVTVQEFFSLTCTHCADFANETFPQVRKQLIDTGKVFWVFRDFPLDQVALLAAQVARYLPPERYEPFILALFANQDRWAFAEGVNSKDELWKTAALAGMSRTTFDKAVADTALRDWILQQRASAQKEWSIDSTPTFVINGKKYAGEMPYGEFVKLIPGA